MTSGKKLKKSIFAGADHLAAAGVLLSVDFDNTNFLNFHEMFDLQLLVQVALGQPLPS
jgi:hypothetical protein